ncbi:MAG: helix-turn-helix domain-containing protein [Candidatus Odinarchaeota archaeon]
MLKLVIEMNPSILTKFMQSLILKDFFSVLERIDVKALLKIDLVKGVKIAICDIYIKKGFTFDDFVAPEEFSFHELEKENNKHACLVKYKYKKYVLPVLKRFNLEDISPDLPMILTEEKIVISFIGEEKAISRLLKLLKAVGWFKILSLQTNTVSEFSLLSLSFLTERQKEALLLAKKHGYYDVPRKITAEELATKLGITKSTIIEHLRKAENRIISTLLAGY